MIFDVLSGSGDIPILSSFRSTYQKQNDEASDPRVINPITRPHVDLDFMKTSSFVFAIAEVSFPYTANIGQYRISKADIKRIEPFPNRVLSIVRAIVLHALWFMHMSVVTLVLQNFKWF